MKDQYGNYVVQKVLEVCSEPQREALLARVRQQLHALKRFPYGKHIVSRVEKLLSAGTRYQTHARGRLLPDDEALIAARSHHAAGGGLGGTIAHDGLPFEDPVQLGGPRGMSGAAGMGQQRQRGPSSGTGGADGSAGSPYDSITTATMTIMTPGASPNSAASGSAATDVLPSEDPSPSA